MQRFLCLIGFILFSTITYAQTCTIKGQIFTTDNKPAASVYIALQEIKKTVTSAENGAFEINNIPAGNYTIVVFFTGLQTITQKITVTEKTIQNLQFTLRENAVELNEVVVNHKKNSNNTSVNIGRIAINPMDLPQAVTTIYQGVLKEQQAQRLSDVLKNVNGVYLASTRGATQENFSARGYSFSSTNMFKDGVRINTGSMPEISSLEKVEILKGSTAILFGNVAPGGVVNLVTKQPKFTNGAELSIRTGSFNLFKPAVDVYGPVNENIAYRLNATYENAGSYRAIPNSIRYYVNPSFLFKLNSKTELIVQADYLNHQFTPDFGIGTYDNTKIPNVARSTFFGTNWQYAKTQQTSANTTLKHQFNNNWQLTAALSYQQYSRDYYSIERIQAAANGDWARPLNKTFTNEKYYTAQVNVNGKFTTGKLKHTLLAGIDAERYFVEATTYNNPTIYDTINIFNPAKFTQRTDIPVAKEVRLISTPTNRIGAYVQDLIHISTKVKLLAGIRFSYQDARPIDTFTYATQLHTKAVSNKVDQAFSPRVGLVYRPTNTTSIFISYANSFTINSGTDVFGNALAPSIVDQFEAGIKNEFFKGKLSANLTVYRIENNNLAQTALFAADGVTPNNNTNLRALTGQTMSDGVELDFVVHAVKGLDVTAGYSYNFIRYTKTPDAKGNFIEGERLINNPASTANTSAFYTLSTGKMKGLKLGIAAFFTGTRFAGFNNTKGQTQNFLRNFEVAGFTTIDASIGYNFKKLSLMGKVANITNVLNYYVHENYSINPIAPTQVTVTVGYKL